MSGGVVEPGRTILLGRGNQREVFIPFDGDEPRCRCSLVSLSPKEECRAMSATVEPESMVFLQEGTKVKYIPIPLKRRKGLALVWALTKTVLSQYRTFRKYYRRLDALQTAIRITIIPMLPRRKG